MAVRNYSKQAASSLKVAAGVTLTEGKLIGTDSSGNAILASKTTSAIVNAVGIALHDAKGDNGDYVAYCPIAKVDGFTSLTQNGVCYLSTSGGITQTRPTTAGDRIQAVGTALDDKSVQFFVVPSGILAQAAATTTLG